ncbi:MAG: hypothetical protein EHM84_03195 [Lysobacterales bacterium]|nr:MAG: hypothetical protein EHM84_03195 [Xanthomonadales bacterium]
MSTLEIELVPRVEIDLLDVPILVLDFDDLFVRIDRQHLEDLVFFEVLVPLSLNRIVVSGHATPQTTETGACPPDAEY